jgi:hypothetical protein
MLRHSIALWVNERAAREKRVQGKWKIVYAMHGAAEVDF